MKKKTQRLIVLRQKSIYQRWYPPLLCIWLLICNGIAFAQEPDWPRWRGATFDGKSRATGVFPADGQFDLKVTWRKALGSGYSSISITGGRAVTMFSDGTLDYVAAFATDSGQELWRVRIDSTLHGRVGSHDGPISTPAIVDGRVFALGPKGHLLALDLETGTRIWSHALMENFGAPFPFYGIATSPIVYGNMLIVQAGLDSTLVSGFDKDTGALLWSAGRDGVSYQSPVIYKSNGIDHLLSVGDKFLYGIEPVSGRVLWSYPHHGSRTRGSGSLEPVLTRDDQIFLTYREDESILVQLHDTAIFTVTERWKTRDIKNTFNPPIYLDGYLYGYSNRFLTCIDAVTGKRVWRSRQPGNGFTIFVDGHLIITTLKGGLHIALPSPEEYHELASLQLFDHVLWSPASFAGGKIFGRSLKEIAAVEIVSNRTTDVAVADRQPGLETSLGRFLHKAKLSVDRNQLVTDFIASQNRFPIVEADGVVHFVLQTTAEDVGLESDITGFRNVVPMTRLADTDFFHYSTTLQHEAIVGYAFIKDFEEKIADPLNPNKTSSLIGKSWLAMPGYVAPKHLDVHASTKKGQLDTVEFASKITGDQHEIPVYLPHGYSTAQERYPVFYVHRAEDALAEGKMVNTLNNLIGEGVRPLLAVFIPRISTSGIEQYAELIAKELVPFIDANYHTLAVPEYRASFAVGFAGRPALYSAFGYPDVFGKAGSQSAFMITSREMLKGIEEMVDRARGKSLHIYLDWGKYDIVSPLESWNIIESNRHLMAYLKKQGHKVAGGEANAGHGWFSWRARTDKVLEFLFPSKINSINRQRPE